MHVSFGKIIIYCNYNMKQPSNDKVVLDYTSSRLFLATEYLRDESSNNHKNILMLELHCLC